ncbi:MAG: hypothetical protein P8Q42_07320 [Flavobacteriales bacterium]|nr:hypothetical protein [Flavobacteriales bacterium]
MIYIVVILIFICLAFVSGYLLFSYIRKRADKEREVNNSNLKYVEDLRRNVIQQFDVIISTLSPKFDAQIINLNLIKNNIEKTPFSDFQKNFDKQESLKRLDQQIKEVNEYITNIGIEYVSKETILSLTKKLNF